MALQQTTQERLNNKLGTTGLTIQQCLQRLAGATAEGMTAQDAANNYAGTQGRTVEAALNTKVGKVGWTKQDAAGYL